MKSFSEVKYEFTEGLEISAARDGNNVRLTFEETDGDDCKRMRVSMTAASAREAATLLHKRAIECEGEPLSDDTGTVIPTLVFGEDAETHVTKEGQMYFFHVSGEIHGERHVLNFVLPQSVLMAASKGVFGDVVLMGFSNLMARVRGEKGEEE